MFGWEKQVDNCETELLPVSHMLLLSPLATQPLRPWVGPSLRNKLREPRRDLREATETLAVAEDWTETLGRQAQHAQREAEKTLGDLGAKAVAAPFAQLAGQQQMTRHVIGANVTVLDHLGRKRLLPAGPKSQRFPRTAAGFLDAVAAFSDRELLRTPLLISRNDVEYGRDLAWEDVKNVALESASAVWGSDRFVQPNQIAERARGRSTGLKKQWVADHGRSIAHLLPFEAAYDLLLTKGEVEATLPALATVEEAWLSAWQGELVASAPTVRAILGGALRLEGAAKIAALIIDLAGPELEPDQRIGR